MEPGHHGRACPEAQSGIWDLPDDVAIDDGGQPVYRDTGQPVPVARRPGVLPFTTTPDGGLILAMPRSAEILGEMVPALGRAAQMAGRSTRFRHADDLASREARIYDPPVKPARPFEADYPAGAPADAAGRLTHDIEGRPLVARDVVGRRVAGGHDEALPPEGAYALAEATTGLGPQRVAARKIRGNAGAFRREYEAAGNPKYAVLVDKALDGAVRDRVIAHEVGHAVD